ncbi:MAG: cell division protein FtsQ/DivIB [Burkholderiaceae bacterium]|jgi:cell division protein FtsQ
MIGLLSRTMQTLWRSPLAINRFAAGLVWLTLLTGLAAVALWVARQPAFALKSVQVVSLGPPIANLTKSDIRQAIEQAGQGTALTTPLHDLRDVLEDHAWVRQVSMRRVWPNRLLVWVEEHEPIAIWADGQLINSYGELFSAQADLGQVQERLGCQMPRLLGPVGSHLRVMERAMALQDELESHKRVLTRLELTEQLSWKAVLDGALVVELGRDQLPSSPIERLQGLLMRLESLEASLETKSGTQRLALADLRYANGFAFRAVSASALPGRNSSRSEHKSRSCLPLASLFHLEGPNGHAP